MGAISASTGSSCMKKHAGTCVIKGKPDAILPNTTGNIVVEIRHLTWNIKTIRRQIQTQVFKEKWMQGVQYLLTQFKCQLFNLLNILAFECCLGDFFELCGFFNSGVNIGLGSIEINSL